MKWYNVFFLILIIGKINGAFAGVVVGGTRVVYDASKREASISIKNPEKTTPYLIQSWVESDNSSEVKKAPFVVTPPLFRLDAGQENLIRIISTNGQLPEDKESVFWLNVKSIPSSEKNDKNQLQITVRTRIKIFYRPESIKNQKSSEAYKLLTFSKSGNGLVVHNPTPFYISFYSLKVNGKEIKNVGMVSPRSTLPIPANNGNTVAYQTINDFGGITKEIIANF